MGTTIKTLSIFRAIFSDFRSPLVDEISGIRKERRGDFLRGAIDLGRRSGASF